MVAIRWGYYLDSTLCNQNKDGLLCGEVKSIICPVGWSRKGVD